MVDTGYQGGVPTVDPRGDVGAPYQRTTPTALSALGDLGTTIAKVGDNHTLCGSKLSAQAELFAVQESRVEPKRVCKACLKKEI